MISDYMKDTSYISSMRQFYRRKQKLSGQEYLGLHLQIGVVYNVDKTNLTVDIGINLIEKTKPSELSGRHTIKAMIISRSFALELQEDASQEEVPIFDVELPSVGSFVIYGYLNGSNTGTDKAVCFGCVNPLRPSYNNVSVNNVIKQVFTTMQAIKYRSNKVGYYYYEKDDGGYYQGRMNLSSSPYKKVWEKSFESNGSMLHVQYANDGETKVWQDETTFDGNRSLITFGSDGTTEIYKQTISKEGNITEIIKDASNVEKYKKSVTASNGNLTLTSGGITGSKIELTPSSVRLTGGTGGIIECT